MKAEKPCPCGGTTYAACCGPYHAGLAAPDPQALMRSRYSAFALGLEDYLLATWHASTRPDALDVTSPPQPKWIGLQILEIAMQDATHGSVHFVARCRINGKAHRQEENSRFIREDDRWYYLDGAVEETES